MLPITSDSPAPAEAGTFPVQLINHLAYMVISDDNVRAAVRQVFGISQADLNKLDIELYQQIEPKLIERLYSLAYGEESTLDGDEDECPYYDEDPRSAAWHRQRREDLAADAADWNED